MKKIFFITAFVFACSAFAYAITDTETPTVTETATETVTETLTDTVTETATETVTETVSETVTETATETSTATASQTETATQTQTGTVTETATSTNTNTMTITATCSPTNTKTVTMTNTITKTVTLTPVPFTPTVTPTITITATPFLTPAVQDYYFDVLSGKIYPNPASNNAPIYALFKFTGSAKVTLQIYSIDGRKVKEETQNVNSGEQRVTFSSPSLAPGIWFTRFVIVENGKTTKGELKKLVIVN
ncbi:MAG TPA: T9SS type A sorting domain-containing protein [Candidatus Goldiibacteriota bacterium]|nr:T9SS type A sorting domain-containing protein [Candidatus Goldiibacteriota bacterium]